MTNKEFLKIILRQSGDTAEGYEIKSVQYDEDEAALVIFDSPVGEEPAVIYPDGTCFTLYDWQDSGVNVETFDDIENYRWYDHEHDINGIVLCGLPRIFC